MDEPNINLGRILSSIRAEKGLSLRDFCDELGISHAYLSKLEKGIDPRTGKNLTPTIETLAKIADGINMPLKKLLSLCGYLQDEVNGEGDIRAVISLESLVGELNKTIDSADSVTFTGEKIDSKSEIIKLLMRELAKESRTIE